MLAKTLVEGRDRAVVTTTPDTTATAAARLLHDRRIGALVVVDGSGAIVGILSERDVARGAALHGGGALDTLPVSALMSPKVTLCNPTDSVEKLMAVMTGLRIRHLPMVEDGKLVGMVSIGDVVKAALEDAAAEAQQLRDYIAT
ncbi:MAG: CBS domain-containing protein [Magnetospirillum sp. WYHS-4]